MENKNYEKSYEDAKKFYWSIRLITCPALNNERIIFHGAGWRHLVFKSGRTRSFEEQINRFNLLKHLEYVIKNGKLIKYDRNFDGRSGAEFWRILANINNQKIIVVIRQLEGGPKHFFSIMN